MRRIVIFRLDDICSTMNSQNFRKIKQIFEKYEIKPLIGIVPQNEDKKLKYEKEDFQFWEKMRNLEKEGWSIAMHGVNHVYDSQVSGLVSRGKKSEFSGHSYNEQYEKICKGKEILNRHHINTDIFFAPSHSYDINTVKVLYDNGFRIISDGRAHWCYKFHGIKFIPCRKYEYDRYSTGIITICLHINHYSEKEFDRLENFIIANKPNIISYSDALKIGIRYNKYLMLFDEKLYVLYERYIRYAVSPYYQKIRQIRKLKGTD